MLSIIIPTYNGVKTIVTTLNSIKASIDFDFEIIIVIDGSNDSTHNVLIDYFKDKLLDFKIHRQVNSGVSIARNAGIKVSKHKFIMFLDDDDILVSKINLDMFKDHTNKPDLIFFNYFIKRGHKKIPVRSIKFNSLLINKLDFFNDYLLFKKNRIRFQISSVIFSKELLVFNELKFNPNFHLGEDSIFILESILKSQKIHCYIDYIFEYRIRPSSSSNSNKEKSFDGFYAILYLLEKYQYSHYHSLFALHLRAMNSIFYSYRKSIKSIKKNCLYFQEIKSLNSLLIDKYPNIIDDYKKSFYLSKDYIFNLEMYNQWIIHFLILFILSFLHKSKERVV